MALALALAIATRGTFEYAVWGTQIANQASTATIARQKGDQQAVREEFAQTRRTLIERKLPEVILARHDEAVKTFEQRVASFNQTAARLQQGDASALGELQAFFDQNPTKRRAARMDPKNLPWRTPEPTKRLPAETKTAWFQNLYGQQGVTDRHIGAIP